jgi:hypothetical protein
VLAQFAQAAGRPAPQLATTEGGTRIEWHGGAGLDLYDRSASGSPTLTPYSPGDFYRAVAQSDLRGHSAEGEVSWMQLALTATDDRSVVPLNTLQINTLSLGRVGEGYRVSAGDVPVSYSALGANTAFRGLLAEKYFGPLLVSGSAGVISESWEALDSKDKRRVPLRNAYALKLETPLGGGSKAYLTAQGYEDASGASPLTAAGLLGASGRSATAGFSWRQGPYSAQGEAGASRWSEEGGSRQHDSAFILDGAWQGDRVGLRAGYHDIGPFFASLSTQAGTGVTDLYANANWTATEWLSLLADLRRSRNEMAAPPVPPPAPTIPPNLTPPPTPFVGRSDALTLRAQITLPSAPGLGLGLTAGETRGKGNGTGDNDTSNWGATLGYSTPGWNATAAFQNTRLSSSVEAGADGSTDTWTFNLGRSLSDAAGGVPAAWTLGGNLTATFQRQDLSSGAGMELDSYALLLTGQHVRWGNFSASAGTSRGTDATGGNLELRWYQVDAGRKLGERGGVKVYARGSRNYQDRAAIAYDDDTVGVQLTYAF